MLRIDVQAGATALHGAARCGQSSTAKVLLEADANINAKDNVSSCAAIAID